MHGDSVLAGFVWDGHTELVQQLPVHLAQPVTETGKTGQELGELVAGDLVFLELQTQPGLEGLPPRLQLLNLQHVQHVHVTAHFS